MGRQMKNSGIEWVGDIPDNWVTIKLKYIANKIERGTSPNYTDEIATRVVNQATFSKGYFDVSNLKYSTIPALQSKGLLIRGDVLLASTGGGVLGKTWYFNEDEIYVADGHVTIVRTISSYMLSKFIYYIFLINYDNFNIIMARGSTNQIELQRGLLQNMRLPVPPIKEQERIAGFLDKKCGEIDGLIADIKTQVQTLEQNKRSVIAEAVTKGLNPSAEMKDSGIEWVGKIPQNWEVMPNKYFITKRKDICPTYNGENILSLTMNGVIVRDLDAGGKMPTTFDGYQRLSAGNLLMCLFDIDVTPRCIGLIKCDGVTSPAYSQYIVKNKAYAPFYNYYYLMVDYSKELLHMAKNLRHSLNEEQFGAIKAPVPPLSEQKEIADYLDNKCAQIEELISAKQSQIETLESYKKSLIYEYVTGKKEVV